jgi:hypothetical protein
MSIAHQTSAISGRFSIGNVDASRHGPWFCIWTIDQTAPAKLDSWVGALIIQPSAQFAERGAWLYPVANDPFEKSSRLAFLGSFVNIGRMTVVVITFANLWRRST